jgi:predicted CXXCH cytochrome family protein
MCLGLSLIVFLVVFAFEGSASAATIKGSSHDFSSTSGGITDKSTDETQVCIFCHTPHGARPKVPLWNRTISAGGMTYTMYSNPKASGGSMDANPAIGDSGDPGNPALLGSTSRLCLSCHDGTISISNIINRFPNDTPPAMGSGNELDADGTLADGSFANIGGASLGDSIADLSNDHPISFVYSGTLASNDGELYSPASKTEIQDLLQNYSAGEGNFECSSCHDPHNSDTPSFLVMSNDQSKLCLTCHIK